MAVTEAPDSLQRAILQAIEARVAEMLEEEEARAIERVRQRIRTEAAAVCASVVSNIKFDSNGRDLIVILKDQRGQS